MLENFKYDPYYDWSLDTNFIAENYVNSMNLYVYNATDFISLYHNLDHYISNNKVIIFSPKTDCGLTIDQVFEKLKYHYENI